jgi:hypothetical protein
LICLVAAGFGDGIAVSVQTFIAGRGDDMARLNKMGAG